MTGGQIVKLSNDSNTILNSNDTITTLTILYCYEALNVKNVGTTHQVTTLAMQIITNAKEVHIEGIHLPQCIVTCEV